MCIHVLIKILVVSFKKYSYNETLFNNVFFLYLYFTHVLMLCMLCNVVHVP